MDLYSRVHHSIKSSYKSHHYIFYGKELFVHAIRFPSKQKIQELGIILNSCFVEHVESTTLVQQVEA